MGRKFSLVLNREVTDAESVILRQAGCAGAIFGKGTLLTDADVTVTKMDFDDIGSMTLVEAIESALAAVKQVPDLYVPGLSGPVYPAKSPAEEEPDAMTAEVPEQAPEAEKELAEATAES